MKPQFVWKRKKPGYYLLNGGNDVLGGVVVRLAEDDWRVYGLGGGLANLSRLKSAKKYLEAALLKSITPCSQS